MADWGVRLKGEHLCQQTIPSLPCSHSPALLSAYSASLQELQATLMNGGPMPANAWHPCCSFASNTVVNWGLSPYFSGIPVKLRRCPQTTAYSGIRHRVAVIQRKSFEEQSYALLVSRLLFFHKRGLIEKSIFSSVYSEKQPFAGGHSCMWLT